MKISLLQQHVTEQASLRPDATAVSLGGERVTYRQLEEASNRLANLLHAVGCRRRDRVCLALPKTPLALTAILGILKADCVYTPLDITSPAERLGKILKSLEPRLMLASGSADRIVSELLDHHTVDLGWLDTSSEDRNRNHVAFTRADFETADSSTPSYRNMPDDPAYILFTSGSTGVPKGVVITHANVLHFITWAIPYFGIDERDDLSGHLPLHFDLSVFDMFGAFFSGAHLHLVPHELNLLPHKLAEFIRSEKLTQWFSVPSVLQHMAKCDAVRANDFPTLQRVIWCGEVLPTPGVIYWMGRLPTVTFTNLYGPTESTIASSFYTLPSVPANEREMVPIGIPCKGEELVLLDDEMHVVPVGEVGNLYIGGVGLSPGYWRDQEKTEASFVPDPRPDQYGKRLYKTGDLARRDANDVFYFLGRSDSQIKSRGYRIELGEIESALHGLEMFQECAVVAVETPRFEGALICCAFVPPDGVELHLPAIRSAIAKILPSYMIPVRWKSYHRLPKNINGKIDRRQLMEEFLVDEAAPTR